MSDAGPHPRVVLLVEDNPADAYYVQELLEQAGGERYQIIEVGRVSEAVAVLATRRFDAVLLDLRLPDASGVDAVRQLREPAGEAPLVILTGTNDPALARACIDAGAQDYLCKEEIRAVSLRCAIDYAITRLRTAQLRALNAQLAHYRGLSSAAASTAMTAALAGAGPVSARSPQLFIDLVRRYTDVLDGYLDQERRRRARPRDAVAEAAAMLGDDGGGPRDVIDLHMAALERSAARPKDAHARALVDGQRLPMEMMALLVDYYRVGSRRRAFGQEAEVSKYMLSLYVTGRTLRSQRAIENLRRICDSDLRGAHEIEVVDVLERPGLADEEKIMATPTLVKRQPEPVRRIVGDLSDRDQVLLGLDLVVDLRS